MSGRYRYAFTVRLPSGESVRRHVRGRTRQECTEKADAIRRAAEHGAAGPRSRETLGAYLERWLTEVKAPSIKRSTVLAYRRHLTHLAPLFGVRLSALTAAQVQREVARLATVYSPAYVRLVHAVLRTALADVVRARLLPANPAAGATLPRLPRVSRAALAPEQLVALIDAAEAGTDRLTVLWALFALTGLRKGEALGIQWDDLDLERGTLSIRRQLVAAGGQVYLDEPKTREAERVVSLPPPLPAMLRAHRARQNEERLAHGGEWGDGALVFTYRDGRRINPSGLDYHLRRALARASLPYVRVHDLRHSFASLALSRGLPLPAVAAALGHASPVVTLRVYAHLVSGDRQRVAEVMGDVLREARG